MGPQGRKWLSWGVLVIVLANIVLFVDGQQNGELIQDAPQWANIQRQQRSNTPAGSINKTTTSPQPNNSSLKVQFVNEINGLPVLVQFTYVGPPKILPIATADSYPEGSSINLICTVSGGQRRGLTLGWTINGQPLDDQRLRGFAADGRDEAIANNLAINTDDADISILKIKNATLKNSGHYTCTANNPLGQDSTSVDININVELKWVKTPKDKVEVGLGQQVSLECEATGSPQPTVRWLKHSSDKSNTNVASKDKDNDAHFMHKGQLLKIQKAQHADSGLYECAAKNGAGPDLRRFVQLVVRGK